MTNFSHCNVADEEIAAARVATGRRQAEGAVEDRAGEDHQGRSARVPVYEQLQLWAWKDTLDLGYELQGSLNLSPPITEKTRFTK